jgi:hypothetical protein
MKLPTLLLPDASALTVQGAQPFSLYRIAPRGPLARYNGARQCDNEVAPRGAARSPPKAQIPTRAFGKTASVRNRPTVTCYGVPAAIKPKLNRFRKLPRAFGYATYPHLIHTEWFVDIAQKQHTAGRALIAKAVDKETGLVVDTDPDPNVFRTAPTQ